MIFFIAEKNIILWPMTTTCHHKTTKKSGHLQRRNEIIVCVSVGVLLMLFALVLEPVRTGDGKNYFGMLVGLAKNGSPAITDEVHAKVFDRLGENGHYIAITGSDGKRYAVHFFAYPLICLPAFLLLDAIGNDVLKAFQLTNALIVAVALFYVLVISKLSGATRWVAGFCFVLSSGSIYFQWTHPEVFAAALVLIASVAFCDRRYVVAALAAATGSLQNPSIALMILPIFVAQGWGFGGGHAQNLLSRNAIVSLGKTAAVPVITLVPYLWNYVHFGTPISISSAGFIDYSLISVERLVSFVFDLNQGLIVGLPFLIWSVPAAIVFRLNELFRKDFRLIYREDLLLLAFLFMAIPTLAQINWNSGHSVFLRYAAWAGMAPLVWAATTIGRQPEGRLAVGLIPAVALQLFMALYIGGFHLQRVRYYVDFQPWVVRVWNAYPHLYDPLPEIFYERLIRREAAITVPAIFQDRNGEILRVLTRKARLDEVADEVCGSGSRFVALDTREGSTPKIRETERGFYYVTGRLSCAWTLPVEFSLTSLSTRKPRLTNWSHAEAHGTWSLGEVSSIYVRIHAGAAKKIRVHFEGHVFVTEHHQEQVVRLLINGREMETWRFTYPHRWVDRQLLLDMDSLSSGDGNLNIQFMLPNAISPSDLGISGDQRKLGISLKEIKFESIL